SSTSSRTTRIWKRASGSRLKAGKAPTPPAPPSSRLPRLIRSKSKHRRKAGHKPAFVLSAKSQKCRSNPATMRVLAYSENPHTSTGFHPDPPLNGGSKDGSGGRSRRWVQAFGGRHGQAHEQDSRVPGASVYSGEKQ